MRTSQIALVRGLAALALTVAVAAPLGGCYRSQDRYTYDSRTWSPKTVVLVDNRTEEEIWRYDVPVGVELRIKFFRGDEDNLRFPDEMRWEAKSTIGTSFDEKGEIPVPPEEVRRVDWYLRSAPEYPRPDAPAAEPKPMPTTSPAQEPAGEPVEDPAGAPVEPGDDGQG